MAKTERPPYQDRTAFSNRCSLSLLLHETTTYRGPTIADAHHVHAAFQLLHWNGYAVLTGAYDVTEGIDQPSVEVQNANIQSTTGCAKQ